jgi:hypothetical protein
MDRASNQSSPVESIDGRGDVNGDPRSAILGVVIVVNRIVERIF